MRPAGHLRAGLRDRRVQHRGLRQQAGLREFRVRGLLHPADRGVHPHQRHRADDEQQHEAGGPDADDVVQRAEGDRQDEAAQAADQPDHATHGADTARVVDRDVLVDRRLAEAHEEAEAHGQQHEGHEAERDVELDRAADAADDVVRGGIAQAEGADHRTDEGPVHHLPRAVLVGERAAEDSEHRAGDRVGGAEQAGRHDVEAVDADIVARQPEGERDEAAEDEEVVQAEPPDLQVRQRRHHRREALGLHAAGTPRGKVRVVLRQHEEQHGRHRQARGPDLRDRLPAETDHHDRRQELRDGRAHIARAEDAERGALLLLRVPLRHVGDAHREGPTRDADAERGDQEGRVVMRVGEQEGRDGGRQHHQREHDAAAILVGPDAEEQADQAAGEDRRADEQAELRVREAEVLLHLHAEDREDRPCGEADREGRGAAPEGEAAVPVPHRAAHRGIHVPLLAC
jgi:hypothetical protein